MWGFLIKFIVTCASVLCTIITLVQFVLGIANLSDLKSSLDVFFGNNKVLSTILMVIVSVILMSGIFVFQIKLYIKKSMEAKKAGEYLHRFHNDIRDEIFKMRFQNDKKKVTTYEDFYGSVCGSCKSLCDKINLYIKEKSKKDFSVCIKLLQTNPDSKPPGVYAYTLCRSGHDCVQRTEMGKQLDMHEVNEYDILIPVEKNTAFDSILSDEYNREKPTIFACSNLRMLIILNKILGRPPYLNPNKDFLKYYKSTIVVPIRINKVHLDDTLPEDKRYLTMGFLCLDYKKTISKALKDELAGYSKSFADAFFNLFYEIRIRDRDIATQESR